MRDTTPLLHVLAICAAAAAFLAIASLHFDHGFFDDSYISLRYVKNLVNGHGLSWNPGEGRTEGFTSLAWVALLGAFGISSNAELERLARDAGIATGLAVMIVTWLVTRSLLPRERRGMALIAPLHLAFSALFARHAISGMETMLAALAPLLVTALWTVNGKVRRPSYWIALALLVLAAILVRPDAAVYCLAGTAALAAALRREEGVPYRPIAWGLATFGLCLAAFLAWKLWYFGSVIPLPAHMKLSVLRVLPQWRFVLGHWLGFVTRAAPLLAVIALGFIHRRVPFRPVMPLMAGMAAHALYLLTVLPVMSVEYRFWFPIYPPLVVVAAFVVSHVVAEARDVTGPRTVAPRLASIAFVLLFVFMDTGRFHDARVNTDDLYVDMEPYRRIAMAVRDIPGISVAVSEVGELPYQVDCRVLDLSGLNDRFIARNRFRHPRFHDEFSRYLLETWGLPDLYVEPEGEYTYALLGNQPALRSRYDPRRVGRLTVYVLETSPQRERLVESLRVAAETGAAGPT